MATAFTETMYTSCGCCSSNPGCSDPEYYSDGGSGCVDISTCTFYAIDDVITLTCMACGSTFADYVVTLIECLGGGECRYTLTFVGCVP